MLFDNLKPCVIAFIIFSASCQRTIKSNQTNTSVLFSVSSVAKSEFESVKASYKDQIIYDTNAHKKLNGWLKLSLQDIAKSPILFHDTAPNEDDAAARGYYYIGSYSHPDLYILYGLFYEDWEYYLVDKKSGAQIALWDKPYISPNHKYIACYRSDGLEGQPIGLQILQIQHHLENEAEPMELVNIFQLDQKIWNPEDLVWENDTSLLLKITKLLDYSAGEPKVGSPQYLKFTFQ